MFNVYIFSKRQINDICPRKQTSIFHANRLQMKPLACHIISYFLEEKLENILSSANFYPVFFLFANVLFMVTVNIFY